MREVIDYMYCPKWLPDTWGEFVSSQTEFWKEIEMAPGASEWGKLHSNEWTRNMLDFMKDWIKACK